MRHILAFLALGACAEPEPPPAPEPEPQLHLGFERLEQTSSLSLVSDMAFLPGSSDLLAVDVTGAFAVLRLEGDVASPLLEGVIDDVHVAGTAGLVGVALDPGFATNRYFYVGLTDSPTTNVLRRYTLVDGDATATLATGVEIFRVGDEDSDLAHNVSAFDFDEDGHLWLLVGDKQAGDVAQDPADWRGKLVRIDPSREPGVGGFTSVGADPIVEGADPAVVAMGIRSPWKGLYRDGRWFFGDVGDDDVEEVNVVVDGLGPNLGWPTVEGPCAGAGCEAFQDPWISYDHDSSDPFVLDDFDATTSVKRSVYVGWIYEPVADDPYEGRWDDVVTFGDTFVGFVRAARTDGSSGGSWHAGHLEYATAWAQGPDGFVYVMALDDWPADEVPDASPLYRAVLAP